MEKVAFWSLARILNWSHASLVLGAEVLYVIVGSKWSSERLDIFDSAPLQFFLGGACVCVLSAKVNTEKTIY